MKVVVEIVDGKVEEQLWDTCRSRFNNTFQAEMHYLSKIFIGQVHYQVWDQVEEELL